MHDKDDSKGNKNRKRMEEPFSKVSVTLVCLFSKVCGVLRKKKNWVFYRKGIQHEKSTLNHGLVKNLNVYSLNNDFLIRVDNPVRFLILYL